jgi:predicted RNase H-like HicB family nuclease
MNTQGTLDYRVQIFRSTTDGVERWKAFVVTIPAITAEGESREEVLENIRQQLDEAVATSEIVKVSGPYPEAVVYGDGSELDLRLQALGWKHYGIFADDPGALELFDEIERQRDQNTIGGE